MRTTTRKISFSKHNAVASKFFITGILKSFPFANLPATHLHFIQIFLTSINTTRNETNRYVNLLHFEHTADYAVYNTVNLLLYTYTCWSYLWQWIISAWSRIIFKNLNTLCNSSKVQRFFPYMYTHTHTYERACVLSLQKTSFGVRKNYCCIS
jgi:hypothetical protein